MSSPSSEYNASSISHVKGLEAVRRRPGMYIGGTGTRALTHTAFEVIDNSVDEATAGFCDEIGVLIAADGSVQVTDNGRGIPVDDHPETGEPAVIMIMTELHAGGKLDDNGSYKASGGLNGVGASVVNALSARMDVEVDRDGQTHAISFRQGEPGHFDSKGGFTPSKKLIVGKGPSATGTRVRYFPDRDIFDDDAVLEVAAIEARLRQTAFLVPGLTITFTDETGESPRSEVFRFDGGTKDFVEFRATDRPLSAVLRVTGETSFANRVKRNGETTEEAKPVEVDVAFRWGIGYEPNIASFVNIVQTPLGGTHVTGLERALVKVVTEQLKTQRVAKAKDAAVIKDDILEGLTAVVTVRLPEPKFLGQTKDALDEKPVASIVADLVAAALTEYFTGKGSKAEARRVLEKIQEAARTRVAAKETKEAKRRKTALESASMPAKLVDCRSEDIEVAELFIVEGDSALGTLKLGRDADSQAALPIRGKILNTERASEKQMLANAECAAIIQVMGAGSGRSFNIDNIRYGKLLILADADVDGAHIRCLLLTLCWRYMRPLLEAGRVYATVPPLHRLEVAGKGEEFIYTYSDDEMKREMAKLAKAGKKVKEIQRYKGLGEMDEGQLWETTLDPKRRRLRRMTLTDGEAAATAFEMCMGEDVTARRSFIIEEGGLLDPSRIDTVM